MIDLGAGIAIAGITIPVGGVIITALLKRGPTLNGKYVQTGVCDERHKRTDETLRRIEDSVTGLHKRLDAKWND